MTEISLTSIGGTTPSQPSTTATTSAQEVVGSLFGDDIIGQTEDTASDSMKAIIKQRAQNLVKLSKKLKKTDSEGNVTTNSSVKKSIEKQMKTLREMAETAGIDVDEIFSEIVEDSNMSRKQIKQLQTNLGVTISDSSDSETEETNSVPVSPTSTSTTSSTSSNGFATLLNNFFSGFSALTGTSGGTTGVDAVSGASATTGTTGTTGTTSTSGITPTYKNSPNTKLDQAFLDKTKQIAKNIGCDYKELLAVMNSESGLNSKAVNKHGGATGLIQFMPATAKMLGTTTEALKNMSPIEQLDYVEKYFTYAKNTYGMSGRQLTGADLYALVYMPARAKGDVISSTSDGKAYSLNKGLDLDHDGKITKADLQRRIASKYVDESKVFGTA